MLVKFKAFSVYQDLGNQSKNQNILMIRTQKMFWSININRIKFVDVQINWFLEVLSLFSSLLTYDYFRRF